MTNLTLNDGSTVLLMKETDLEELIEERLGNDVRKVIEELRREAEYNNNKIERELDTDLGYYEGKVESLNNCLSDLRDSLLEMKELMNEPKVPKIKLFKRILNAVDLIENNY